MSFRASVHSYRSARHSRSALHPTWRLASMFAAMRAFTVAWQQVSSVHYVEYVHDASRARELQNMCNPHGDLEPVRLASGSVRRFFFQLFRQVLDLWPESNHFRLTCRAICQGGLTVFCNFPGYVPSLLRALAVAQNRWIRALACSRQLTIRTW